MLQYIRLPLLGLTVRDVNPQHSEYHKLISYEDKVLYVNIWQALLLFHPKKYLSIKSVSHLVPWLNKHKLIDVYLSLGSDVLSRDGLIGSFINAAILSNYYSAKFSNIIEDLCDNKVNKAYIFELTVKHLSNRTTDCILRITNHVCPSELIDTNHHYTSLNLCPRRMNVEAIVNTHPHIIKYLLDRTVHITVGKHQDFYSYVFNSCTNKEVIAHATSYYLVSIGSSKHFMDCLSANILNKASTLSSVLSYLQYHISRLTLGAYWIWLKHTTQAQKSKCPLNKHNIAFSTNVGAIIKDCNDVEDAQRFYELSDTLSDINLITIIESKCNYDIVAICLYRVIKYCNRETFIQNFHMSNASYISELLNKNTSYTNTYKLLLSQL